VRAVVEGFRARKIMAQCIPVVLVEAKIATFQSKLDEIAAAMAMEMAKPINDRNHLTLLFLEFQRQKFALSVEALSELSSASIGFEHD